MTDSQFCFFFFGTTLGPLVVGGLIAQVFAIRSEIARLRSARVVSKRERA
ncbi:MAG: hypothetical protein WC026_16750 [Hyphomicrobium sp.]